MTSAWARDDRRPGGKDRRRAGTIWRLLIMATELLHDLMKRSRELTREEKQRLVRFLSELVKNSNGDEEGAALQLPRTDPRKGQLSVAWLKAHADEYAGQHVALDGDQLVGSGRTMRDARTAAKSNGYPQALLVHVPPREGGTRGRLVEERSVKWQLNFSTTWSGELPDLRRRKSDVWREFFRRKPVLMRLLWRSRDTFERCRVALTKTRTAHGMVEGPSRGVLGSVCGA